jgi:hypothetical protein
VVDHEGQRQDGRESNVWEELSSKKKEERYGKGSHNEWNNPEVSLRVRGGIEQMSEDEEKGRMKGGRIFFMKIDLGLEVISGVVKSVDFVQPERFLVEGIESEGKSNEETQNQENEFIPLFMGHENKVIPAGLYWKSILICSDSKQTSCRNIWLLEQNYKSKRKPHKRNPLQTSHLKEFLKDLKPSFQRERMKVPFFIHPFGHLVVASISVHQPSKETKSNQNPFNSINP